MCDDGCGVSKKYFESDVAHFVRNFFQAASSEVAQRIPTLVSVSVHGFAAPSCTAATNTSFAVVSNGTTSPDGCLASDIARAYAAALEGLYTGEPAGSCNAVADDPAVVWRCSRGPPCGTTNVQGRAINGSSNPCITSVSAAPLPERFIHLEQQRRLRDPPESPDIADVSWQITIDVFAAVFACYDTAGDCDRDGEVNLIDYSAFFACLTGPGGGRRVGCDCFDLDRNCTVDLRDFRWLQWGFSGS